MALETVGGAALNALLSVLLDRITPEFKAFFETRKMDGRLLEKLEIRMITVNEVLDYAEQKQFTTLAVENSPVKKWLDKLRDVAYEADDLLDLIAYEVTAARIQADRRTTARDIDAAQHVTLEAIVERLGELVGQIVPLGLRDGCRNEARPQRQPTTSLVEESDIFGRDADKDAILKLLEEDDANTGVIPIVGMGGIGKTTLAGLVYEHSMSMTPEFEKRAWVCVSDNYDGLKIKKELLKQVNESVICKNLSVEQIDRTMKESLKGKRFLLVLDDMWNESRKDWDDLQKPLKSGKPGSKIIVTTRSEGVASIMRTVKSYQLRILDDDYSWRLFSKRAFNGGNEDPKLKAIGEKIVSKCKGLPLAIKMLGDLLRLKQEVEEWEAILSSDIWDLENDEILPALRLSYWHLPSHLKQCFVYCAIFPKDYRIQKEEIIQLWMAEGFLVKPKRGRGRSIVEWGEDYLQELVSRSFLQKYNDQYLGSCFLMHDLVNDLAQDLSREFLIRMDGDKYCECDTRYRYFSFMGSKVDNSMILDTILKAHFLRTFLSHPRYELVNVLMFGETCVNDLQCLRVLRLSVFRLVELPESIGNLRHLRYLDLQSTRVERLPETLCSLYNLQTVILYFCRALVELPKDFGNLINLHFLDIRKTPKLKEMPPQMGNLKDLQTLCKFYVGKQNGSDLNELGKLQHLRGELSIYNLENVVGSPKDILKNKERLKELALIWSGDTENTMHENKLLEGLQPHTSIEKLSIFGYGGTRFADWVGHFSYSNIVSLKLHGCKNCISFPSLDLSSLEDLSIYKFDAVEEVSMKIPLNSLKTLHIEDMKQWQKWIFGEENDCEKGGSLAKLEELIIKNCPELKCITRCGPTQMIFESLNYLMVEGCSPCLNATNLLATLNFKQLVVESKPPNGSKYDVHRSNMVKLEQLRSAMYGLSINKFRVEGLEEMGNAWNALEDVTIKECESVECIPLEVFPVLKSLHVESCDNLKSLSACGEPLPHPLTSLTSLTIRNCQGLTCFPKGGISAPNLTILWLWCCSSLKSLPERMHDLLPSLELLDISNCEELESFPTCGEPLLHPLMSLTCLNICNCRSLTCFPKGGISAPNLTILQLWYCSSLKSLPEGMHHLLPSLEILSLLYCNKVESFPEGGLPTKLKSVEILNCNDKVISGVLQWGLQTLDFLSHLSLGGYEADDLDFFPQEKLLPFSLASLKISDFKSLKYINCQAIRHLANLIIYGCPNLQSLEGGGLPSSVSVESIEEVGTESSLGGGNEQSLIIERCDKLICSRLQWGMHRFNALSDLSLCNYKGDDLDSFPEESVLPSTLNSLEISVFTNLKGINYKGLQHLTSLSRLKISHCPNLQCLPREGLPSSLSELEISYCPNLQCLPEQGLPSSLSLLDISGCSLLERRCEREIGEDWPRISHISTVKINFLRI